MADHPDTRPTPLAPWTREELAREIDPEAWTMNAWNDNWKAVQARRQAAALALADRIFSRPAPTVCLDGSAKRVTVAEIVSIMDQHLSPDWGVDSVGRTGAFIKSVSVENAARAVIALLAAAPLPPFQKAEGEGT